MRVVLKGEPGVQFHNLAYGDVFLTPEKAGLCFMKTREVLASLKEGCAVNLVTGELVNISPDAIVFPYDAELSLTRKHIEE